MKSLLSLLLLFFVLQPLMAQTTEPHIHDRYCRHYPEQFEVPAYAYRNDWQSDLVHNYDVNFYFLDLAVSSTSIQVGGTVEFHATVVADDFNIFAFELNSALSLDNIIFNDVAVENWTWEGDNVLAEVPTLQAGDTFVAKIEYGGTPPTGGFFSGITNDYSNTWQKDMTWTLSEPYSAKDWWPNKQVLTDKADSVWVFLTTTTNEMAGSQGLLTNITDLGNNQLRYEWKSNYPVAYYLISFAVSDYQEYNIYAKPDALENDSILVQNFIYNHPNYLNNNKIDIDATVPMIELFSDLYAMYPFKDEKYGHCITTLGGGMEHQTMTTLGGFSFGLVAHELGHMWFGDNVTCATWSDIWVNEGFATYSNFLAVEHLIGHTAGQNFMVNTQNSVMSSAGGSVYVPPSEATPDDVWRIFNGRLTYDKGAAIIHVLRHEINNDELFYQVLNTYQEFFTDSTATGDDFRMIAEQVTGMDFEQFFNQWYYGQGYPRYDIEYYMFENTFNMYVTQTTSSITPLFQMTMDYKLTFSDNSDTIVRLFQGSNLEHFALELDKQVVSVQVDPDNWTFERVNSIVVGTNSELKSVNYFSAYPNPVTDVLNIVFTHEQQQSTAVLHNSAGQVLRNQSLNSINNQLDMSDLPKGVYFLTVSNEQHNYTRKLIK
ncbi:MAG: M1 family aminopeptidase [Bacteroidales bacterium]|jgi:aminopeptidase N|nr:M1 family aminopeptidase [Bacteroidales bacterium]